ncbi:MAG: putative peptidoglycan glycosyltransferase FtsW [Actinomycetes bacterium]
MNVRQRIEEIAGRLAPRSQGIAFPREYAVIVGAVTALVAFGTVMVYSASSAQTGFSLPLRTVFLGLSLGIPACLIARRVPLDEVRRHSRALMAIGILLLVLVLIPGLGQSINGARRWLGAGPVSFQASEIAKVALVLFLSSRLLAVPASMGSIVDTIRLTMWPLLAAVFLIAIEPDMGTALVCLATGLAIYWLAGTPWRVLGPICGGLGALAVFFAVISPYRFARLTAFIDPGGDPTGAGFQSMQGQIAIGSGGITGVGPGQSVQKIFYLPEAHTDFILAVIGEELGLFALLGLLLGFGAIAWAGIRVSQRATDPYAKLVAAGMTTLVTCQAMLNICVVLGIAPLTGVPLPFISYGPTNLVVLLSAVGLLLNVAAGGGKHLRAVDGDANSSESGRHAGTDRSGRNGGARRSGAERRRRTAG